MSQFEFLQHEWSDISEAASKAEQTAIPDSRTSCFYARRALELAVYWAYKFDRVLKLPYQDNISTLIHEPTFKQTVGKAVFAKAKVIVTLGNRAVHTGKAIPESDSTQAVKELFHFCYWFARLYPLKILCLVFIVWYLASEPVEFPFGWSPACSIGGCDDSVNTVPVPFVE